MNLPPEEHLLPSRPVKHVGFALAITGCAVSGCAENNVSPADADQARALLADVRMGDYRNWQRSPGWSDARRPSTAPHSNFVDIYVNEDMVAALADSTRTAWPLGAIVVKDGWAEEDADVAAIVAIMEKRDDGAWFWAEFGEDDDIIAAGVNIGACASCHASGADSVRAFGFP